MLMVKGYTEGGNGEVFLQSMLAVLNRQPGCVFVVKAPGCLAYKML